MASVHKQPRSPFWFAFWRDGAGRLHKRSTKQENRNKALAVALEYERAEKLATAGSLTEAQAREVLADILKRAGTDEALRCPSIAGWLQDWLATKEASKSAATGASYGKVVRDFTGHLGRNAERPLTALTARHVEGFLAKRLKEGCSPTTVTHAGKVIRSALHKARREGLISTNPAEAVDLPGLATVERGTFTTTEVGMLVAAADGEWPTLILLAYFTGARLGDCCAMQWDGIDLANGTLTYRQRKTGQELTVPLHPELLTHLEGLATVDTAQPFIMPHMAGLKPGGRHGLSEGFKRVMRKAGLDLQTVQGGGKRQQNRRTFHALRHSFTSALANAAVAPELRMRLTGHKTEAIHRGYTHHELETLRGAVAKLPGLATT